MIFKNISVALWFILILFTTLFMSQLILSSDNTAPVIEEDRLYVTLNDIYRGRSVAEHINSFTDSYSFDKGDNVIVTFTLPKVEYDFPTLLLPTQFVGYKVYLDGRKIYEKRVEQALNGDFLPKDVNFITLPYDGYEGAHVTLDMFVSQDDVGTILYTPYYGNFNDLTRGYTWNRALSVFLGTFMCMYGVIFLLISLFFALNIRGLASQIRSSILCFCGGAWILTSQRINVIFMTNTPNPSTFEYMLLYLSLPLLLLLFCTICHLVSNRIAIGYICCVITIEIIFALCHFTRVRYINTFSRPFAVLYGISVIAMICYSIFYLRRRKASTYDKVQIGGLDILALCLVIAALFFFLDTNGARMFNNTASIFIGLGGIIFVASRLMTFLVTLSNADPMRKKEIALSALAYMDSLTGLPNRTSCDKETMQLDESDADYMIMSLDLNGLKEVNDSKGHKAGDELLQNFAGVLKTCFPDPFFRGRTGGDEFIVIEREIGGVLGGKLSRDNDGNLGGKLGRDNDVMLDGDNGRKLGRDNDGDSHGGTDGDNGRNPDGDSHGELKLEDRIRRMNDLLRAKERDTGFDHSVAYGYCYRHEFSKSAGSHEVYMEADARMYELKRRQHEMRRARGDNATVNEGT